MTGQDTGGRALALPPVCLATASLGVPLLSFALVAAAAFLSGIMNAVAGGGAFLTFPALLLIGVPPVDANASSTVALFPGQLASAWAYRRDMAVQKGVGMPAFIAVSVAGGLLGALILLATPNAAFARLVPWLMAFATAVFAIGNFAPRDRLPPFQLGPAGVLVVQFLISVYGGYFGGGIGFLMLAAFTLYGMRDIHAMNGLRILLAALLNGAAVLAFAAYGGVVRWPETLAMAAAAIAGGFLGAHGVKRVPQAMVKRGIVGLGLVMTLYLFWRAGWF